MNPISSNHPHSHHSGATPRAPAPATAPIAPLHGTPAGQGVNAGAMVEPCPAAPPPSRGGDLERPLGEHLARQGTDGEGQGAQRPGFGSSTVRKLRGTEERLTQALGNRGERALANSMDNDDILDKAILVSKLKLGRFFPLPGMKREIKAILQTYNAKFPGLEARMFNNLEKAMKAASRSLAPGQTLRGLAVEGGVHALAVEFRCHADNRISMIVLNSMTNHDLDMYRCADSLGKNRHNRGGRIDSALFCDLDIQRDYSSCAGFAKDFLKEFHRHGAAFGQLHKDTRTWAREPTAARDAGLQRGVIRQPTSAPVFSIPSQETPKSLPLSLFKNLQSGDRLANIVNTHPSALTEPINTRPVPVGPGMVKLGESIPERLHRLTGMEWLYQNPATGRVRKLRVSEGDKVVPMAENYRRMHGKAAEFGETGRVQPGREQRPGAPGSLPH